ncbi:zinc finger (ccch type) motif-containing protein [Cystoisospora suis]|uniref:Zinc finger (Ccch type) motif-containing protein n=1 Tax=Cystoisospora suis TaxID=483139 RepID=A0A2C6L0B5_9APIC|nr:zinc finger (ccch type) motif-containing protein [Cystoisospora suis]
MTVDTFGRCSAEDCGVSETGVLAREGGRPAVLSDMDTGSPSSPGAAAETRLPSAAARQDVPVMEGRGKDDTSKQNTVSPESGWECATEAVDGSHSEPKNKVTEGGSIRRSPSLPGGTSAAEQERLIKHQRLEVQLLQLQRKLLLQEQLLLQQKTQRDVPQRTEEVSASGRPQGTRGGGDTRPTSGVKDKRKNGGRSDALKAGCSAKVGLEQETGSVAGGGAQAGDVASVSTNKMEELSAGNHAPGIDEGVSGSSQERGGTDGVAGTPDPCQRSAEAQETESTAPAGFRGVSGGRMGNRVRAQSDFTDISLKKKGARIEDQFFRIKLCPKYVRGLCRKGSRCSYAHTEEQLRDVPNLWKTKLCSAYRFGKTCPLEEACPYAHGEEELRSTADYYKTKLCKFWMREGRCEAGKACRHAHGDQELRKRNYRHTELEKFALRHHLDMRQLLDEFRTGRVPAVIQELGFANATGGGGGGASGRTQTECGGPVRLSGTPAASKDDLCTRPRFFSFTASCVERTSVEQGQAASEATTAESQEYCSLEVKPTEHGSRSCPTTAARPATNARSCGQPPGGRSRAASGQNFVTGGNGSHHLPVQLSSTDATGGEKKSGRGTQTQPQDQHGAGARGGRHRLAGHRNRLDSQQQEDLQQQLCLHTEEESVPVGVASMSPATYNLGTGMAAYGTLASAQPAAYPYALNYAANLAQCNDLHAAATAVAVAAKGSTPSLYQGVHLFIGAAYNSSYSAGAIPYTAPMSSATYTGSGTTSPATSTSTATSFAPSSGAYPTAGGFPGGSTGAVVTVSPSVGAQFAASTAQYPGFPCGTSEQGPATEEGSGTARAAATGRHPCAMPSPSVGPTCYSPDSSMLATSVAAAGEHSQAESTSGGSQIPQERTGHPGSALYSNDSGHAPAIADRTLASMGVHRLEAHAASVAVKTEGRTCRWPASVDRVDMPRMTPGGGDGAPAPGSMLLMMMPSGGFGGPASVARLQQQGAICTLPARGVGGTDLGLCQYGATSGPCVGFPGTPVPHFCVSTAGYLAYSGGEPRGSLNVPSLGERSDICHSQAGEGASSADVSGASGRLTGAPTETRMS